MPLPPPIDPRQLAAEIEASVSGFNRLAALATSMHIQVIAEVAVHPEVDTPARPILRVQVAAPL
jgi:hypothetical protein